MYKYIYIHMYVYIYEYIYTYITLFEPDSHLCLHRAQRRKVRGKPWRDNCGKFSNK